MLTLQNAQNLAIQCATVPGGDSRIEAMAYLEGKQHHSDINDGCVQVRAGECRLQASHDSVHADAQGNQPADNMRHAHDIYSLSAAKICFCRAPL